jgi:hypothetical protein
LKEVEINRNNMEKLKELTAGIFYSDDSNRQLVRNCRTLDSNKAFFQGAAS